MATLDLKELKAIGHTRLTRTHRLWGEPALGPTGLRGVGGAVWGQLTIWSRGHFRERLRVLCGRECLAAATGITRLTRGGQNANSYRVEVQEAR